MNNMFISIVFNTEYNHISYRIRWYLKNLLHCKENRWVLISHEYIKNNFKLLQDAVDERFFCDFEMRRFTLDEVREVEQYFVPDRIFEDKEKECGSRTEMLMTTAEGEFKELEIFFRKTLNTIRENHIGEKIEGVLCSLECFGCIRKVCKEENIPLYSYSFSAIRKPHGYRKTLYFAHPDGVFWESRDAENRFRKYLNDIDDKFPIFSNHEILAIIGKERNLPLLQLINHQPDCELARCNELHAIMPHNFESIKYVDDDLMYEGDKVFGRDISRVRTHAMQLVYKHLSNFEIHNDPASFILSCKRLVAIQSQIMLKALLWKRSVISPKYTMDFSFICNSDFLSTRFADIKALNYYLFCYLIPGDLMFSDSYWKWRLTNPTEAEIYKKHLDFYVERLNLPKSILTEKDKAMRFRQILESRNCDEEVINDVISDNQDFDVDYYAASSKFVVDGKPHWRLNKKTEDGNLKCTMYLHGIKVDTFEFYPLDDVAGFSKIISVEVNGTELPLSLKNSDYRYMKKVMGHYSFPIVNNNRRDLHIEIVWQYKKVFDYLNEKS